MPKKIINYFYKKDKDISTYDAMILILLLLN